MRLALAGTEGSERRVHLDLEVVVVSGRVFAEEFARAYEKQIVEFKRVDVGGGTQSFKRVVLEEVEPQSEEIKDQVEKRAQV